MMTTNQLLRWHQQPIEIIYQSKQGEFTKRKIKIWKVTEQAVYGYCYLRKENRKFNRQQILAVYPLSA